MGTIEIHPHQDYIYEGFSSFLATQYNLQLEGDKTLIKFQPGKTLNLVITDVDKKSTSSKKVIDYHIGLHNDFIVISHKGNDFHIEFRKEHPEPVRMDRSNDRFYISILIRYDNVEKFNDLVSESFKWQENYRNKLFKKPDKITVWSNTDIYLSRVGERDKRSLDTIYLPQNDIDSIVEKLTWFLKPETKEFYKKMGKNYKMIILFYGIPGTGKTSLIHALASHFDKDLAMYNHDKKNGDQEFSRILHRVGERFFCMEDADCNTNTRDTEDKHGITFSGIINSLDGFLSPVEGEHPFVCFITTNFIDKLDKTLIRPGRVDHFLEFKEIKKEERLRMFAKHFPGNEDELEKKFSSLKVNVSPATLDMYLFGNIGNLERAISNMEEIKKLKDLTVASKKEGMYC